MWMRYLVTQLVRQAAQEQLQQAAKRTLTDEPDSPVEETPPPSPCALAFLFAVGAEAKGFHELLTESHRYSLPGRIEWQGRLGPRQAAAAECGPGQRAAAEAVRQVFAFHQPQWVVSAGFASALHPDLHKGHILMAEQVLDARGESLETGLKMEASPGLHVGSLLTLDEIPNDPQQRLQWGESRGAVAADLETWAVAEACRQENVRFLSVRIITEGVQERPPQELEKMTRQKTIAGRLGAAAGALFQRPSVVKELWRLRDEAHKASRKLGKFLAAAATQLTDAKNESEM